MAVDTSLVEIADESFQADNTSDFSIEVMVPHDQSVAKLEENIPIDRKLVSKIESLLPINDTLVPEDNDTDLQERKLSQKYPSDKDVDVGETCNLNTNPEDENAVLLQESEISVDENAKEYERDLFLEESRSATEEDDSTSWKLVEEPDLSPEMFESLWKQLPETYVIIVPFLYFVFNSFSLFFAKTILFLYSKSYEVQLDEIPDQKDFLKLLTDHRIYLMASTPPGAEHIRYFLYAKVCSIFYVRINAFFKVF